MRGTVGLVSLCPRAGIDPHADRRGLSIGRVLSGDLGQLASVRHDGSCQRCQMLTVRPFLRVVVSVLIGPDTGVASPLRKGTESPDEVRPRRPCARFFRTSLRGRHGRGWLGWGGVWFRRSGQASKFAQSKKVVDFASHPKVMARERPGQLMLASGANHVTVESALPSARIEGH